LAIILFGSIIFCLFVPQIIDLLITVFCPGPLPPPSPPTPPPGLKCRKRLRLYHYASTKGKRRHSSNASEYYYDPENILNYVSETRIKSKCYRDTRFLILVVQTFLKFYHFDFLSCLCKALKDLSGEDADDELSDREPDRIVSKLN